MFAIENEFHQHKSNHAPIARTRLVLVCALGVENTSVLPAPKLKIFGLLHVLLSFIVLETLANKNSYAFKRNLSLDRIRC